jgi:hypothetical protein
VMNPVYLEEDHALRDHELVRPWGPGGLVALVWESDAVFGTTRHSAPYESGPGQAQMQGGNAEGEIDPDLAVH